MRRTFALLFCLSSTLLLVPAPAASAQQPAARLTLLSQTPWNRPESPLVEVRLRATNIGDRPLDELSIGVTLWGPVISRTEYERTLVADPTNGFAIFAETRPREGTLQPGQSRELEVPIALPTSALNATDSRIYPLTIDLRTGFTSVAAVRTPVIYLVRKPVSPVDLSWTFVLDAPLDFGPNGVFRSTALQDALAPGGRLRGQIRALRELAERPTPTPVDVVVSPTLLIQLARMRDGYGVITPDGPQQVRAGEGGAAAALRALADLRTIGSAPGVELSTMPFSSPQLPSLTDGGLARDLGVQLEIGRTMAQTMLDATPDASVLRPPASAVDTTSLMEIAARGVDLLLLDPATVPPAEQPLDFAPPPTASLSAGDDTLTAVIADPSVQTILTAPPTASEDPVLAAHALLGELAAIWLEQPGIERGLAITFGDAQTIPGPFFPTLERGIADAPWLTTVTATELARRFPPGETPSQIVPSTTTFSHPYVGSLKQARRLVGVYASMLVDQTTRPEDLDRMLLLAEAGTFLGNEGDGAAFIAAVQDSVGSVFAAVHAQANQVITLTSSSGKDIPVFVTNDSDVPLRATISLVSPHLRSTPSQTRVLRPGQTRTLSFDVQLRTTGRFPVTVQISSPPTASGPGIVIGERKLIVRSTAYNRIAIVITIGAALLVLLVWARRFLPRRTS